MEPQDSQQFSETMDMLADTFNVSLTVQRKRAYWMALCDLPYPAIEHACVVALREESFFPPPVILRGAARQYLRDARNRVRLPVFDVEAQATLAQEEVKALIASVWPETVLEGEGDHYAGSA